MGATAARDYVYARLEELRPDLASGPGARRERAREERDFLQRQFERSVGRAKGTVRVDPRLAEAMRERGPRGRPRREEPRTVFPLKTATGRGAGEDGGDEAGGGAPAARETARPPYRAECEGMDFRGLREFIDDSLRTPPGPEAKKLPRRKEEFLDLLRLLAAKGGIELDGDLRPVPVAEEDWPKLRKMQADRVRLSRELAQAQGRFSSAKKGKKRYRALEEVRKLRQELGLLGSQIGRLEARKRGAARNPRTEKQRLRRLKATRAERVARVGRDIERVFAAGGPGAGASAGGGAGPGGGKRLPWRVLPPGELTLEGVLAHYRRLARERPDRLFEPERIEKAMSLDPMMWWEGHEGFGGYVVFEYPGTDRVLLECGLKGNAIYVLGPDWQRLSRLSKREVLKDPSTRRIVHRGEWFETVRAELGLR